MQKYARLFVHGYYLFLEAHPTAKERLLFIFSISDVPQFVNFMSNKIKFLVKNLIQDERAFCYCDSERDIYGTCFVLCIAKLFKRYRKHSSLHLAWKCLVYLSLYILCYLEAHIFPWAPLVENGSLLITKWLHTNIQASFCTKLTSQQRNIFCQPGELSSMSWEWSCDFNRVNRYPKVPGS